MCQLSVRAESRLFVALVTLTILSIGSLALYDLRHDPVRLAVTSNQRHARLYSAVLLVALVSYLRCHFTAPGGAADWPAERPDLLHPAAKPHARPRPLPERDGLDAAEAGLHDDVDEFHYEDPQDHADDINAYCTKCNAPKMPRVHHCSVCNVCVLRFDHHCPWIGSCIGLLNFKYFLLFLLYTTGASLYSVFIFFRYLAHCQSATRFSRDTDSIVGALLTPIALAVSIAALCGVGSILAWNIWLSAINQTGLENYQLHNVKSRLAAVTGVHKDYSAGWFANLRHVLGWNPVFWLLPIRTRRGPAPKSKL